MKKADFYYFTIIYFVLFIILLFPLTGIYTVENIIIEWEKTYGAGDEDIWIIKLDKDGNLK